MYRYRASSLFRFELFSCSVRIIQISLITALAKSECFTFHGGNCHYANGEYLKALGISSFFFTGTFVNSTSYHYKSFGGYDHNLINCVTQETVTIIRAILALCVISNACTLCAFALDLFGPKRKYAMITRRNGILNIISLFLIVAVCGFCHWVGRLLFDNLHDHKRANGSKVIVSFGISYYILIGAAVANIFAAACNLLRRYPPRSWHSEQSEPILYDMDLVASEEPAVPQSVVVREPPPYTP